MPPQVRTPLSILTPLQEAALCGDEETTYALLLAGSGDGDAQDIPSSQMNETAALYLAAQGGHLAVVNTLLGAGANVNGHADLRKGDGANLPDGRLTWSDVGSNGRRKMATPLHYAALHGHSATVQALLDADALRNPPSPFEYRYTACICTPLLLAAGEGHLDTVSLEAHRFCSRECTPLILAAKEGHAAIVTVLLEAGSDVNYRNNEGAAAIHEVRDTDTLEALLRAGTDPNLGGYKQCPFDRGYTPLGVQISACGHRDTIVKTAAVANVQLLLSHGANVDQLTANGFGYTSPPVEIACEIVNRGNSVDVLSILLDAGANFSPVVPSVIWAGCVDALRFLLRAGADKNARFDYAARSTPLHLACRATQLDCVRELLEWGANPDLREERCETRLTDYWNEQGCPILANPSADEDKCDVCDGLGAFPAHVIGLGSFDLECVNCGHTVLEHVIDRRKYEDEDDVRFGNLNDLTYVPRRSTTNPQQGYVADLRDRNAIRRALRGASAWRRRRGVLLLKARLARETATSSLATEGDSSVDCDKSGSVGDKASVLDYWVRYREQVCASNARRLPSSVKIAGWPSVLAGLLLALDGEEGVFRNVVMFL